MKYKINKIPPLKGTQQEQMEEMRVRMNVMADEITRAMEALEREIEKAKKRGDR